MIRSGLIEGDLVVVNPSPLAAEGLLVSPVRDEPVRDESGDSIAEQEVIVLTSDGRAGESSNREEAK